MDSRYTWIFKVCEYLDKNFLLDKPAMWILISIVIWNLEFSEDILKQKIQFHSLGIMPQCREKTNG